MASTGRRRARLAVANAALYDPGWRPSQLARTSATAGLCQKASGGTVHGFRRALRTLEFVIVSSGVILTFGSLQIAEPRLLRAMRHAADLSRAWAATAFSVTIGSLDDPSAVAPTSQLGAESKVEWLDEALAAPAPQDQRLDEDRRGGGR